MCQRPIGTAAMACVHGQTIKIKGVVIPCNSWNCPECAKRKRIILGNRVKNGFEEKRVRFATFTTAGKKSLSKHLRTLKESWNRLRLTLSREYGLKTFFWVLEFGHERGRPHLHVLLDVYVPQRRLSILAQRAGFGSIVDIREVKEGGGFGYVYKYLEKDCGSKAGALALRIAHGRRFGCSRNIPPLKGSKDRWECVDYLLHQVTENVRKACVQNVAGVLGEACEVIKATGSTYEWSGKAFLDEQSTYELLTWLRSGIIDRYDLLAAGGYGSVSSGGNYLCAMLARQGQLEDVPF